MHVLLNPLPIYGLGVALIALVIGLVLRDRAARVTALAIVFVGALSAWPAFYYGDTAYDRVQAVIDEDGTKWLDEHARRAENLIYLFYALAVVSVATVASEFVLPRVAVTMTVITLVLALVTLAAGAYIAYPGGRTRHREFRFEPPPEKAVKDDQPSS